MIAFIITAVFAPAQHENPSCPVLALTPIIQIFLHKHTYTVGFLSLRKPAEDDAKAPMHEGESVSY